MNLRGWAGAIIAMMMLAMVTTAFAQGDQVTQGAKLYAENCAVCHGAKGEGRVGARLQDFPSINPQAFVKATVANGVPGSPMIPWSQAKDGPLTDADIDAIAAFVATWTTGDVPSVPTEPPRVLTPLPTVAGISGDPTRGALVFRQNCQVCHGEKGEGRAGASLAKPFASAFPAAFIKQAVSTGVQDKRMPAWAQSNGGPLTDQQIDDVTAFILSIQTTTSPTFIEPTPTPATPGNSALTLLVVLAVLIVVIVAVVIFSARGANHTA